MSTRCVNPSPDRKGQGSPLYDIAGEPVAVTSGELQRFFTGFEWGSDGTGAPPPICRIGESEDVTLYGVESLRAPHPVLHLLRSERERRALLLADRDFAHVTLCGGAAGAGGASAELSLAAITARLSMRGVVLLHGAVVALPCGGGICFIGPSGVGKSTQAELWRSFRCAEILNGDKVFLRLVRPARPGRCEVMAYGSPWCGSSPYRVRGRVSLVAIVVLHRADAPSLTRLETPDATAALLARTVLPGWDDTLAHLGAAALDTVARVAMTVPLYAMSCTPDGSAVEALEAELFPQAEAVAT